MQRSLLLLRTLTADFGMPHLPQPGVGKTTLIKKVLQRLSNQDSAVSVAGFYTEELRGSEGRAGVFTHPSRWRADRRRPTH